MQSVNRLLFHIVTFVRFPVINSSNRPNAVVRISQLCNVPRVCKCEYFLELAAPLKGNSTNVTH